MMYPRSLWITVVLCLGLWRIGVMGTIRSQVIPLHVWDQLKNVNSSEDFIKQHITKKPGPLTSHEEHILFSQTGSFHPNGISTIAGMIADPDTCEPRMMSVTVPPDQDARVLFWPTCTLLPQCGGCCGHEMHECAPTKTALVDLQVLKALYPGNGSDKFEYQQLVDIKLEKHLACECRCKVQADHCNPMKHEYQADTCSCRCLNEDQATLCPSNQKWNDMECSCVCPKILNCLADEYFSYNTCDCQKGTPGAITSDQTTLTPAANDPCAALNCRPGYHPVKTGDKCVCRIISRRGGDLPQRSLGDVRASSSRTREHSRRYDFNDFDEFYP